MSLYFLDRWQQLVAFAHLLLIIYFPSMSEGGRFKSPMTVINTWPFTKATDAAWDVLISKQIIDGGEQFGTAISAVVAGCSQAEEDRSIPTVGYGGSPDEEGHTTLDAMVMDGRTMEVGAVAAMPDIREATKVAYQVLRSTQHTLLVGPKAADFARSRGFATTSLDTPESRELWRKWKANRCQPNFRRPTCWIPDPTTSCGPYHPLFEAKHLHMPPELEMSTPVNENNHDTIGMIALDAAGAMAVGLSTSGLTYKIPGRVGDTPIPGAGGYVDNKVGGAVGTGDGDVMMRFLLSFQVVQYMRQGYQPTEACEKSLDSVIHNSKWSGGLVALTPDGKYGAACVGFPNFEISVRSLTTDNRTQIISIPCMKP